MNERVWCDWKKTIGGLLPPLPRGSIPHDEPGSYAQYPNRGRKREEAVGPHHTVPQGGMVHPFVREPVSVFVPNTVTLHIKSACSACWLAELRRAQVKTLIDFLRRVTTSGSASRGQDECQEVTESMFADVGVESVCRTSTNFWLLGVLEWQRLVHPRPTLHGEDVVYLGIPKPSRVYAPVSVFHSILRDFGNQHPESPPWSRNSSNRSVL